MTAHRSGRIITFYSYKGGTGRSMALANVAWVLASNGRRVLAVDWDLEAPGLHRYFYPFLVDKELTSSDGVIDLMIDFVCEALTLKDGERPDTDWYKSHADILPYAASLDWEFPGDGTLDFIPAGRQNDSYSSRVTSFNWVNFYDRLGGGVFLEAVKDQLREEYDYVLIDSRTGVSDASGICTVQMPDTLAVCFTLNNQSIEGAAAVATSVYEQRRRMDAGIKLFPVPMRIENAEKDKLELRREYARKQFERFPAHVPHEKRAAYWGEVEVIYVPYYAYEEILAPFGDKRGQTVSLLASVERLTAYLTHGDPRGEVERLIASGEEERRRVLAEYTREPFEGSHVKQQFKVAEEELIRAAENVFASFTPEQQAIARRVLSRLVRVAPPEEVETYTRLRVRKLDLGLTAQPILDELLYQQLVLLRQEEATKEETVELAHDVLAEKWKRLQTWLVEDRDFLLWRQELQLCMARRESSGHIEDALLQGAFLTEAEQYRATRREDLTDNESALIVASMDAALSQKQAEEGLREKEAQARRETVQVRKEKKRLAIKYSILLIVILLGLVGAYQFFFYPERTRVFLGLRPAPYVGAWQDDFLLTPDGKPDGSRWDYPSEWTVVRGEVEETQDDGALLVQGNSMGLLNIKPAVLVDFSAVFKVRIVKGTKAAWVFRAQSDKKRGYLFMLTMDLENRVLELSGYVYDGSNNYQPIDQHGTRLIPFRGCCKQDDGFRIRAEVEGNEFRFRITVEPKADIREGQVVTLEDRIDTGVEYFIEGFRDNRSLFPYGTVGLLAPDAESQMIVEYMLISSEAIE